MDYSEARAAFFQPREGEVRDLGWSTPSRRLRDAIEPIATISWWGKPVVDAYASHGMDFLEGYVWGRSSGLGDADPAVAAAAFGVFEPGLVADLLTAARGKCSLAQVRAATADGVTASLRQVFGEQPAELEETTSALRTAALAAPRVGRPLFAGWAAAPWPDDPWAALWQACVLLRELRGDGHLATVVSAGLDGLQANVLTELWVGWEPLAYTGSRAWSPDAMSGAMAALESQGYVSDGALTDAGRSLRNEMEGATDRSMAAVEESLGDRIGPLTERLDGWAQKIIDHGWFPPDPYKRAAG